MIENKDDVIANLETMGVKTIENKKYISFYFKDGFIKVLEHSVVLKSSFFQSTKSFPLETFFNYFISFNIEDSSLKMTLKEGDSLEYNYRFKIKYNNNDKSIIKIDENLELTTNKNYTFSIMLEMIKNKIINKKSIREYIK